jgi:recombination protein RecA
MSDFFKRLQDKIDKNVKGVHASVLADSAIATDRYWVKTPSLDLNRILSGNLNQGIQSRNLVGVVGPEHTMKSSFMVLCMVEAQKQGKEAIIIDTEGGITGEFIERWGLDPKKTYYTYTPFVNEVKSILGQIRSTGNENMIIGLDSAGGLEREKQFDDASKGDIKADQGLLQKEIRGMLKLFLNICIAQNSIGIVCGHMYGKPSTVPMPDQIGGGKAMKLFPSILIQLHKQAFYATEADKKDKNKKPIGSEITATTLKNRLYPPFQKATIKLNYTDGVEPYAGVLDLGVVAGMIEKSGAWYSYKEERLGQGAINATKALENFPNIIEDLNIWLENTKYSTVSDEVKQAEELLKGES